LFHVIIKLDKLQIKNLWTSLSSLSYHPFNRRAFFRKLSRIIKILTINICQYYI
jgi:hypothetical protein